MGALSRTRGSWGCVWSADSVVLNLETGVLDFYQSPGLYVSLAPVLNLETPRYLQEDQAWTQVRLQSGRAKHE